MKTKLFLHMGPGYHSDVERELLEASYPEVDFWNQPQIKTYKELVTATVDKINRLVKESKKPITLIGHSFGGTLAYEALQHTPGGISELRLLNSALDPFECFVNLAAHPFQSEKIDFDLIRKASVGEKIQLIIKVASAPNFADLYWQSQEKRKELEPVLTRTAALNPEVFVSVFSDFLQSQNSKTTTVISEIPLTLFYSPGDLLIKKQKDIDPWKSRFKNTQIIEFSQGGHHPHLEDVMGTKNLFKS